MKTISAVLRHSRETALSPQFGTHNEGVGAFLRTPEKAARCEARIAIRLGDTPLAQKRRGQPK